MPGERTRARSAGRKTGRARRGSSERGWRAAAAPAASPGLALPCRPLRPPSRYIPLRPAQLPNMDPQYSQLQVRSRPELMRQGQQLLTGHTLSSRSTPARQRRPSARSSRRRSWHPLRAWRCPSRSPLPSTSQRPSDRSLAGCCRPPRALTHTSPYARRQAQEAAGSGGHRRDDRERCRRPRRRRPLQRRRRLRLTRTLVEDGYTHNKAANRMIPSHPVALILACPLARRDEERRPSEARLLALPSPRPRSGKSLIVLLTRLPPLWDSLARSSGSVVSSSLGLATPLLPPLPHEDVRAPSARPPESDEDGRSPAAFPKSRLSMRLDRSSTGSRGGRPLSWATTHPPWLSQKDVQQVYTAGAPTFTCSSEMSCSRCRGASRCSTYLVGRLSERKRPAQAWRATCSTRGR